MARLPDLFGDRGKWGSILLDFLRASHNEDGSLKSDAVGAAAGDVIDDAIANNQTVIDTAAAVAEIEAFRENALGKTMEPDRTLSVVGDLHFGITQDATEAHERLAITGADLATLSGLYARRVYVGDVVDSPGSGASGNTPGANDLVAKAWMDALDDDYLMVAGNHDVIGGRTSDNVASIYGQAGGNFATDLGFCRLIGIAPDSGSVSPYSTISSTTLAWLDDQLRSDRKDTIVLCHYPLWGTAMNHPVDRGWTTYDDKVSGTINAVPDADIREVLDKHPHARIWLCGHTHTPIRAHDIFKQEWLGTRHIAVINASSPVYTNGIVGASFGDPPRSIFLTMLPDRVEIRVRNHQDRAWEPYEYQYVYPMYWNVPTLIRNENPASMVASFDGEMAGQDRYGPVAIAMGSGAEAYTTISGRQGLDCTDLSSGSQAPIVWATVDTSNLLYPTEGTIVVRAAFGAEDAPTDQYVVYHNPSGANSRIYIMRAGANERVRAQFGDGSAGMNALTFTADTNVHTMGVHWHGHEGGLWMEGEVQRAGPVLTVHPDTVISTIGDDLRLGAGTVLFDVYLATRKLTAEEHAILHATPGPWPWDILA